MHRRLYDLRYPVEHCLHRLERIELLWYPSCACIKVVPDIVISIHRKLRKDHCGECAEYVQVFRYTYSDECFTIRVWKPDVSGKLLRLKVYKQFFLLIGCG